MIPRDSIIQFTPLNNLKHPKPIEAENIESENVCGNIDYKKYGLIKEFKIIFPQTIQNWILIRDIEFIVKNP